MNKLPAHAKKVFEGKIFEIWQWEQAMFDGSTAIFERAKRSDAVTVLPITKEGKILITEQLQPHWPLPALCLPGGVVDPGEELLAAAKRELREETGCVAEEWTPWKTHEPSERIMWSIGTFVARGCEQVGELELDPGEKITVRAITLDDLLDLADSPDFRHHDIQVDLVRAKYHSPSRAKLEQFLFGSAK